MTDPIQTVREALNLAGCRNPEAQWERRIQAALAALDEIEGRVLPKFKGILQLQAFSDGYEATVGNADGLESGQGPTPREAVDAAIAKITDADVSSADATNKNAAQCEICGTNHRSN